MQKTVSRRAYIAIDLKIVLRIGRVHRARSGSVDDESGRGESIADGENDLSGGIAAAEILMVCRGVPGYLR